MDGQLDVEVDDLVEVMYPGCRTGLPGKVY